MQQIKDLVCQAYTAPTPTANGLLAGVPPAPPQCKAGCVSCRADALQQCSACLEGFALANKTCVPCATLVKGCSVCKDVRCVPQWGDGWVGRVDVDGAPLCRR